MKSLQLFKSIYNNDFLRSTTFVLFMNKFDVFQKKLLRCPIREHFNNYHGDERCLKNSAQFLAKLFQVNKYCKFLLSGFKQFTFKMVGAKGIGSNAGSGTGNIKKKRPLYAHYTSAVEPASLRLIFAEVTDMIIRWHLMACGLY